MPLDQAQAFFFPLKSGKKKLIRKGPLALPNKKKKTSVYIYQLCSLPSNSNLPQSLIPSFGQETDLQKSNKYSSSLLADPC